MHSRDKARKSLCMFSSSFFTASGLLVPDMIYQTTIQFGRRKRTPARSAPSGDRQLPQSASGPSSARLLGSAGLGPAWTTNPQRTRAPPAAFSQLSRLLSEAPPPPGRPAPLGSSGSGRGAHQAGRSLPLPRGPAAQFVSSQPGKISGAGRPSPPDLPTPLAESPTIPSAAGTRQPHFRAPRPPPPPRPTGAVSRRRGVARGVVTSGARSAPGGAAFPSSTLGPARRGPPFASSKFASS